MYNSIFFSTVICNYYHPNIALLWTSSALTLLMPAKVDVIHITIYNKCICRRRRLSKHEYLTAKYFIITNLRELTSGISTSSLYFVIFEVVRGKTDGKYFLTFIRRSNLFSINSVYRYNKINYYFPLSKGQITSDYLLDDTDIPWSAYPAE